MTLTGADLVALADAVTLAALPAKFDEQKPANQTGHSAHAALAVDVDGATHELVIEGMTSVWGSGGARSELGDDAKNWLSAVESVRQACRDVARRELPDAH